MTFIKNSSLGAKIAIGAIGVVFAIALLFGSIAPAQAALTTSQVDAIISLLQAFGADQSVVDNVRVSLTGGTPTLPTSGGGGGGGGSTCITLKYNMYFGIKNSETNNEVTILQKFLAQDSSVYPEGQITGYYGPLTINAVKKWQAKNGVVSSGTPDTTGYGAVGPKTRKAMRVNCGGGGGGVPTPFITVLSPNGGEVWRESNTHTISWDASNFPTDAKISIELFRGNSAANKIIVRDLSSNITQYSWKVDTTSGWGFGMESFTTKLAHLLGIKTVQADSNQFKIRVALYWNNFYSYVDDYSDAQFSIVAPGTNLPPVISGVSGPTTLNIGQTGTWTVKANDPENGTLSYSVNWGDEFSIASNIQPTAIAQYQTATFTHSYATAGVYTPTFTVTDNTGQQAKTSISVNVGNVIQENFVDLSVIVDYDENTGNSDAFVRGTIVGHPDNKKVNYWKAGIRCIDGAFVTGKNNENLCNTENILYGHNYYDVTNDLIIWTVGVHNNSTSKLSVEFYIVAYDASNNNIGGDREFVELQPESSITILTPNGGEKWQIKSIHTITWTPYSYNPDINPATAVTAYLEKLVNGSFVNVGKVTAEGKASIHWGGLIGLYNNYNYADPGTYYIRVINNQTGEWDRSDNSFQLVAEGTIHADLKINNSDGPLEIPIGGATYNVSWTSNAEECTFYNYTLPSTSSDRQISGLDPSGSMMVNFLPNTNNYNITVSLWCVSNTDIEGSAKDGIVIRSSTQTVYQCSDNIDNDGDGLIDYPNDPGCKDTTDNDESNVVIQPSITITSPNGGESIDWSSQNTIIWSGSSIGSVSIALYKNDKFFNWIATNISAYFKGGYNWTPSDVIFQADLGSGNIFKIYIIGYPAEGGSTVTDKSDSPFSIVAPATNLPDLVVNSVKAGTSSFVSEICNQGNVSSGSFGYKVSANGVSKTLTYASSLSVNQCASLHSWGFTYYGIPTAWIGLVEVSVDPENLIEESVESNNSINRTVSIGEPTLSCTDSDGGQDYFVKGTITGPKRCIYDGVTQDCTGGLYTVVDKCVQGSYDSAIYGDKPQLLEIYCGSDGRITGQGYLCPNGCSDGACIVAEITFSEVGSGRVSQTQINQLANVFNVSEVVIREIFKVFGIY